MVKKAKKKFSDITLSTSAKDKRVLSIAKQIIEILSYQGVSISNDNNLSELNNYKDSKIVLDCMDLKGYLY